MCVCERMQPFFKCSYEFHLALWSIYLQVKYLLLYNFLNSTCSIMQVACGTCPAQLTR